jgi:hypothetical protein
MIGLIMATGNVGHHLHSRQDEVNTYFSRDAGRSWEQIAEGSYIYEFGDHGALMIVSICPIYIYVYILYIYIYTYTCIYIYTT